MAPRKSGEQGSKKRASDSKSEKPATAPPRQDGVRETFESIVVAFVLAFLFRTFEAEAFVIPTGSMAPTLLGRHKDVECEKCKTHFTVGASDEVHSTYGYYMPAFRLDTAFCPSCRYEISVRDLPVFKGDRILVNKFPYEFGEPERFDVIVFKFPEEPTTNYIKRLIGLPGEELRIERGDVFARSEQNGNTWQIVRKDNPDKQRRYPVECFTTPTTNRGNFTTRAFPGVGSRWSKPQVPTQLPVGARRTLAGNRMRTTAHSNSRLKDLRISINTSAIGTSCLRLRIGGARSTIRKVSRKQFARIHLVRG